MYLLNSCQLPILPCTLQIHLVHRTGRSRWYPTLHYSTPLCVPLWEPCHQRDALLLHCNWHILEILQCLFCYILPLTIADYANWIWAWWHALISYGAVTESSLFTGTVDELKQTAIWSCPKSPISKNTSNYQPVEDTECHIVTYLHYLAIPIVYMLL